MCVIELSTGERDHVLTVKNDGIPSGATRVAGRGLRNMTQRITAVNGTLHTDAAAGLFVLRAHAPVRTTDQPTEPISWAVEA